jgi:hypothetical protein
MQTSRAFFSSERSTVPTLSGPAFSTKANRMIFITPGLRECSGHLSRSKILPRYFALNRLHEREITAGSCESCVPASTEPSRLTASCVLLRIILWLHTP